MEEINPDSTAIEVCIIIILCSGSPWQLTTWKMQCEPKSCLGDTQCQQRGQRLQSVCFLYLSVSSLLLSEHIVSHCAGLLVLSWNPKHPSWVAMHLGDCPCSDIGLPVGSSWMSVWAFAVLWNSYYNNVIIITPSLRKSPQNTYSSVSWNHGLLLKKCNATLRPTKKAGRSSVCYVFR